MIVKKKIDLMIKQPPAAIILVAYDTNKTLCTLGFLRSHPLVYSKSPKILVLNNSSLVNHPEIMRYAQGWFLINGTNEQHEISGWQEGLDYLMSIVTEPMPVLFLNDTVISHRHFTIFRTMALRRSIRRAHGANLIGFVNLAPRGSIFSINDLSLAGWVSTYCFFLTPEALETLKYRIWDPEILAISVKGGLDEEKFFGKNLSPDLQRHLCRWLFERGWYAAEPLRPENIALMVLKARSIIAEKWLTARCLSAGVEVIDPFEQAPWLREADYQTIKYLSIFKKWYSKHFEILY